MEDDGEFTMKDFKEFSNIYAREFNRSEMHDRVLVLDVFSDNTEDEINQPNQVSRGIKQEKERLSDEDVSSSRAGSETHDTTGDLDASVSPVGKTRLSVKQKRRKASKTVGKRKVYIKNEFAADQAKAIHQHKIFAHSSWLSVHSNYFRALFYSGLKESNLKEVHLRILKSEEAAHLHLIEAMYRLDVLNTLPVSELVLILVLADKYDAKFVFRKCKYVLKTQVESAVICEKIFNAVKVEHHIVDVEDLINAIQKFMANKFSPFDEKWESSSFQNLSEHFLTLVLSSDELVVSCEDVVFNALMHWIENNPKYNLKVMPKILSTSPLLSVIRFQSLTTSYLLSIVQHHPIAKQMANFNDYYIKAVSFAALPRDVADNMFITASKPECRLSETVDTNIVNFRWKMPEKEVLKALAILHSQPFWACGYRVQLSLCRKHNNGDKFCVVITLKILSLKEGGFTSVAWQLRYKGKNIFDDDHYDHEYIFTANADEREKEGSFTWSGSGSCVLELIMKPCSTTVDFCCEDCLF